MGELFRFLGRFLLGLRDLQLSATALLALACGVVVVFPSGEAWPIAMPLALISALFLFGKPRS